MSFHDLPTNWTQIFVALIGLAGGGFAINRVVDKRAERTPKPKPKASQEQVAEVEDRVNSRIDELEDRLADTVQRLDNRTRQYNGIRAAWYIFRDLVLTWKSALERHDPNNPAPSPQLLEMLYNALPVEDDPEVYDTKRREEIQALRERTNQTRPDDEPRRRPRH